MKTTFTKKQIEGILSSKIEEWVGSLTQTALKQNILEHYIISGGAIVSLLLGEEPNDYDIYYHDVEACYTITYHYCEVMKSKGFTPFIHRNPHVGSWIKPSLPGSVEIQETSNEEESIATIIATKPAKKSYTFYGPSQSVKKKGYGSYKPIHITSNSITLTDDIQIVTRVCGNPIEIHKTFDFIHCVNYYTPETGLVLNKFAIESILTKELKYMGTPYPICSLFRMKKFIDRGWTISHTEMLKIITDIMKTPLNKKSLEFQLQTGLNSSWNNLIENLPDDMSEMTRIEIFELLDKLQ